MGRPQPSAPLGPLPFRESVIGRNGFRSPALSRHSLAPQANYADNGLSTPPAGAVALSGVRAARGRPRAVWPLRAGANFASGIKLICPVQSSPQKYCAGAVGQISGTGSRVLSHIGGVGQRHQRGKGCGGRGGAVGRTARMRAAKSCGPDAPTLASSLRKATLASEGG